MAIHRIKRFSSDIENDKSQKKEPDPKDGLGKDLVKMGIATGGTIYGVKKGRDLLNDILANKSDSIKNKYDKKENKELFKKLKRIAKKQKTAVIKANFGRYTSPINENERKKILDELKETKKIRKKIKEDKKLVSDYINEFGKTKRADIIKDVKKDNKNGDKITKEYINELKNRLNSIDSIRTTNRASTLAHELGHSKYYNNRSNGFGEKIHKLSRMIGENNIINPASVGLGFGSGLNSYIKKAQGKKEGKLSKATPYLTAIGLKAPTLIKEGMASYEGYRKLKDLGASKEFLKNYKKDLGNSFGTHATGILTDMGNALIARQLGKLAGRGIHKIHNYAKKRKNKNKNKEED